MNSAYPSPQQVDHWVQSIWDLANTESWKVERLEEHGFSYHMGLWHLDDALRYLKFTPEHMAPFYCYWQPAVSGPAPLVIHVPGYGAEISAHPEIVAQGYNVLHISPLGYATPQGADETKKRADDWPVLQDTIISGGEEGYKYWLANCIIAINWALEQPEVLKERLSFFGTSQGGGGALLLGSLFQNKGTRCVAADLPFLTNFPLANGRGAYRRVKETFGQIDDLNQGLLALGLVDTLSHARRLTCPVLLTAGEKDETCPPETVASLFNELPSTRSLTYLKEGIHRYSREFIPLVTAWLRLYA